MEKKNIIVKTRQREFVIPEGKPVLIRWRAKNKQRPGVSTGIGWLKKGDRPGTVTLIHAAFSTWDEAEQEYPAKWTIFAGSILSITRLTPAADHAE